MLQVGLTVGSVMVHSVVPPVATVMVPVGEPGNCGLTVAVNTTLDSLPTATEDGETDSAVVVESWLTVRLFEVEVEPVKLVSPP